MSTKHQAKEETKHTPPVRVAEELSLHWNPIPNSVCEVLHIRDESGTFAFVPAGFPERAELIVRAVNSHAELVEALKLVQARIQTAFDEGFAIPSGIAALEEDARAAIAKAGGAL